MKRETKYIIEEEVAQALKKVLGAISDDNYTKESKLSPNEITMMHEFYSLVQEEEE